MTEFVLGRRVVQKGRFWLHECRRARADKGKMQISNEGAASNFSDTLSPTKSLRGRVTTHSGTARVLNTPWTLSSHNKRKRNSPCEPGVQVQVCSSAGMKKLIIGRSNLAMSYLLSEIT